MKNTRDADPDIAPEYDFSKGKRGVCLEGARRGIKLVPLEPSSGETKAAAVAVKSKRPTKSSS